MKTKHKTTEASEIELRKIYRWKWIRERPHRILKIVLKSK